MRTPPSSPVVAVPTPSVAAGAPPTTVTATVLPAIPASVASAPSATTPGEDTSPGAVPPSELLTTRLLQTRLMYPSMRAGRANRVSTRRLIIDPLLDAMGWTVTNMNRVQLAATLAPGVKAEYALILQDRAMLVLDTIGLTESLPGVEARRARAKELVQAGVSWLIQTNGVEWCVVYAIHPTQPILTATLHGKGGRHIVAAAAAALAPLQREAVVRGSLTAIERGRRKGKRRIPNAGAVVLPTPQPSMQPAAVATHGVQARRRALPQVMTPLPEEEQAHLAGIDPQTQALYYALRRTLLTLKPRGLSIVPMRSYVSLRLDATTVLATIVVRRSACKIWFALPWKAMGLFPSEGVRDVRTVRHPGPGEVELTIGSAADLDRLAPVLTLLRRTYLQPPARRR